MPIHIVILNLHCLYTIVHKRKNRKLKTSVSLKENHKVFGYI